MCTNDRGRSGPTFKLGARLAQAIGGLTIMCQPKPHDGPKNPAHWIYHRPVDDPHAGRHSPMSVLAAAPLLVLIALACGSSGGDGQSQEDQRRDLMKGDPFKRWDTSPRGHQRRRPNAMVAPVLALTALACGKGGGGDVPPEDGDPMHHRLRRELGGKHDQERGRWAFMAALPALIAACDAGGQKEGPVFRLRHFTADAVDILTGPSKGGRFLADHDVAGWAHYVFLDDSLERHPFNCRYVRTLRFLRGVKTTGSVS